MTSVAVTSRSFSKHPELRKELCKRFKHVKFNEEGITFSGNDLVNFLNDYDSAIVGLEKFNNDILSKLPRLKVISRFGVGSDTLDLNAMKRLGIKLAVTTGANKRAVAELVIAFSLIMFRQLSLTNQELRSGKWNPRIGRQLSGSCVGIVGFGSIGKDLAFLLKAFNCDILIYDLIDHTDFCQKNEIRQVDLNTLLQHSDIVSLHLPLNENTKLILDSDKLALMKSNAILINTARGGLVDENILKEMLKTNRLHAAAFDVFAVEPTTNHELLSLPNFFGTSHIGGSTEEAILAIGLAAIEGLEQAKIPN